MKAGKIILSVLLAGTSVSIFAQDIMPSGNFTFNFKDAVFSRDFMKFRNENTQLGAGPDSISYDIIDGSPFWADISRPAFLYNSRGCLGAAQVRINLVTNKIHFLKDGEEMILNDNIVNRVVFKNGNDSSVFIGQVLNLLLNNKPLNEFVQVLNFGKYQLLKYTRRKVASEESPSHTSKSYHFTDNINYFIKSKEKVEELKKINKDNLFLNLPGAFSYEGWIKENNINLKSEKEVIRFLNYYNSRLSN